MLSEGLPTEPRIRLGQETFGDQKGETFGDQKGETFGDQKGETFGDQKEETFGNQKGETFGNQKEETFGDCDKIRAYGQLKFGHWRSEIGGADYA